MLTSVVKKEEEKERKKLESSSKLDQALTESQKVLNGNVQCVPL
jgi:hypothetical protein